MCAGVRTRLSISNRFLVCVPTCTKRTIILSCLTVCAFRIFRINWDKTWDRPFCSNLKYILNCHYLRKMKSIEAFKSVYIVRYVCIPLRIYTCRTKLDWLLVSFINDASFFMLAIRFLLRFICFLMAVTKLLGEKNIKKWVSNEPWWSHKEINREHDYDDFCIFIYRFTFGSGIFFLFRDYGIYFQIAIWGTDTSTDIETEDP